MDMFVPHRFGLHLCEYLLIIEPIDQVQKHLQGFKQYFLKNHRYPNAIVSKSHITLMRFIQYDSYEKHIVKELELLAAAVTPFDVELQGFGSFGHTLFVDVKSAGPILGLVAKRRRELRRLANGVKGHPPYFATKPHITIARKLTPPQNEAIWPIWKRTRYHGVFRARNMVLLKRMVGTHPYSVVRKFNFLDMPPQFFQGKLFA